MEKYRFYLLSFLIPCAILTLVLFLLEVYPFGEYQIYQTDLYLQFMPLMQRFQEFLKGKDSLFYAFEGGLGTNFYTLSLYQNMSPITWIFLLLFPESKIVLVSYSIIIVKVGLISLSMYYYLTKISLKHDYVNLGLSLYYAFNGFVLGYYVNLMWLDTLILIPLVILGVRRIIDFTDLRLFVISYSLLLFVGWYLGLISSIFILLYFISYAITKKASNTLKSIGLFLLGIVLSLGINYVVLYPALLAIKKTHNFDTLSETVSSTFNYSFSSIMSKFLPISSITTNTGRPNLYSGLLTLFAIPTYLISRDIPIRERLSKFFLFLIIFASINLASLDKLWHLGHSPYGFPARYSFALTFIMLEMASDFLRRETLGIHELLLQALCIATLYIIGFYGDVGNKSFYIIFGIFISLLFIYSLYYRRKINKPFLYLTIILEVYVATFFAFSQSALVGNVHYAYKSEAIQSLIAIAKEDSPNSRLEIIGTDSYNSPYIFNYYGASIYASSVPGLNYEILNREFGTIQETNRFRFNKIDLKNDANFGFSHYISVDNQYPDLEPVEVIDNCYLYKNPYKASIAYKNGQPVDIKTMSRNTITVDTNLEVEDTLVLAIPYDEGWESTNQDLSISQDKSGLLKLKTTVGTDSVSLRYTVPGFKTGLIVSAISTLIFILICLKGRKFVAFFPHF